MGAKPVGLFLKQEEKKEEKNQHSNNTGGLRRFELRKKMRAVESYFVSTI